MFKKNNVHSKCSMGAKSYYCSRLNSWAAWANSIDVASWPQSYYGSKSARRSMTGRKPYLRSIIVWTSCITSIMNKS